MKIHLIEVHDNEINDVLLQIEVDSIPRIGESMTFSIKEKEHAGRSFFVQSVDYLISGDMVAYARVWVKKYVK